MNTTPTSSAPNARSWEYAEDHVPLPDVIRHARDEAVLAGLSPISTGVASLLTVLSAAVRARHVVEIGTSMGASALAILAGMGGEGILTSIDSEPQNQLSARKLLTAAGYSTARFRLIAGAPLDVLPKLNQGTYDIAFVNGDKLEYVEYTALVGELLRPGGLLIVHDALWFGRVADAADETDEAIIIREALESLTASGAYQQALLPVGNGVLVAVKA